MQKMTFYPLGNADCCCIDTESGRKILFDYAAVLDRGDRSDRRCDLPTKLREDLEASDRDYYDVVAFSHLDRDHFAGFSDLFYLDHAQKYQSKDRVKIQVMWVPAALITELSPDDAEGKILQREARYRFKQGNGIRVFSRPERLEQWCNANGVELKARRHLVTDAGQVAPEFSRASDGLEFFVHSPLAVRQNESEVEDRNSDSIVMHITFDVAGVLTKALLLSDCGYEALGDIVTVTVNKKRQVCLEWDIAKLPHHCSYLALNAERGTDKTKATQEVALLYEECGRNGAVMVSTSAPIPAKGAEDDNDQPPHRQAAAYYQGVAGKLNGQFAVTMEHPKKSSPEPLVIEIGKTGATLKKEAVTGTVGATSRSAPRAG